MRLLRRVHVAGWKSIKDQSIELGPLNVIIGANGAGKSNLLSFFRLLLAVAQNDVARFVARAGGASSVLHRGPKVTSSISAETEFAESGTVECHGFNLAFAGGDKLIIDHERFSTPKPESPKNEAHHMTVGGQFSRPQQDGTAPDGEPGARIHQLLNGIRVYHFHDTSETARVRLAGYMAHYDQTQLPVTANA